MSAIPLVVVPLQATASQTLNVTLGGQACTINVYTKSMYVPVDPTGRIPTDPPQTMPITPVFLDLFVDNQQVIAGVLCENENYIVRNTYLGFIGDLFFTDTQNTAVAASNGAVISTGLDPQASGLGSRWQLVYNQNAA